MGWGGGEDGTGLGVGGARGEGTVPVPLRSEGRFCPAENSLPSGAREEQVSLQSTAMHHFRPLPKKNKKQKTKTTQTETQTQNRQKRICLSWPVFWPGRGQRPLPACPKDLTGWEGGGRSVSPCVQRSTDSVTAVTRAFCRNRPIWVIPLGRSHSTSFLEGIELQESGA